MPKDPEPGADGQLLRALTHALFDLGTAIDLIGNATASRLGVNQTDLVCLHLLARDGPMSPGQVASTLGLTTAAISAMATRLEKGGLAFREMDPKDRRRVLMQSSPAGSQLAAGLYDGYYKVTTDLAASQNNRDLRLLIDLLAKYRRAITDHAAAIRAEPSSSSRSSRWRR